MKEEQPIKPWPEKPLRAVQLECAELAVDQDEIIWQRLLGKRMVLSQAEELSAAMMELARSTTRQPRLLLSYTEQLQYLSRDVRRHFSNYEPADPNLRFAWKSAMIFTNPVQRFIASLFVGINRLPDNVEGKLCGSVDEALAWLRSFRKP